MVNAGKSSAEQPKDVRVESPEVQRAPEALRAPAKQISTLQRTATLYGSNAPDSGNMRKKLFETNLSLYWQQAPLYYEGAKGELLAYTERIRKDLTEANPKVPEVLRDQILEILPALTHATPKGDEVPEGATFLSKEGTNEFRVNMRALDRQRNVMEEWLRNPYTQSNPRLRSAVEHTLRALNLYASRVDAVGKSFFDAKQMSPGQQEMYQRENRMGRLALVVLGGGMGVITGAMALFSKNKDFRLPALYLGLATLAAIGEKRLREYPSETLLREITFIGEPGGEYERVTTAHKMYGPEWNKIATSMKALDRDDELVKKALTAPLTNAEAERLAQRLTKGNASLQAPVKNLILNRADFVSFLNIVQGRRSEEAQQCLHDYIASGANPGTLSMLKQDVQNDASAGPRG
ncbi:hypothetical protein HYZ99_01030 [Candidatus Peregrinibacteria bacterium]|nr:hypothetical protein [Candidatus Peregrinibacteria bacterium]